MNAQELRKHIEATFPAFATKANHEFDKRRLELALAMVDSLYDLANPPCTTREEAEKARIIWDAVTEALNKRGHNYASILSAKCGLEALIEG